ncbi:Ni,Fe-hydrogenase I small subunit [Rhodanobacter sp. K2T2]|uniref:hypothetical protein n=1 Tax=Rhodanobacter sp. K2T2 TaxID=2723085 RepID=UPI0015CA1FD9|nr:hypothetical protein [Rhodanobacter sp. K2T2]NYE28749.1 Ni,Fe-hydrogenase I small subunit [Rhodanobacter sp. K2T2]
MYVFIDTAALAPDFDALAAASVLGWASVWPSDILELAAWTSKAWKKSDVAQKNRLNTFRSGLIMRHALHKKMVGRAWEESQSRRIVLRAVDTMTGHLHDMLFSDRPKVCRVVLDARIEPDFKREIVFARGHRHRERIHQTNR